MSAKLVILVTEAAFALPVSECTLSVADKDGRILHEEALGAASAGRSSEIDLPTPDNANSLEPEPLAPRPYSEFNVTVKSPGCYNVKIEGVQMFSRISSTLPVQMIPLPDAGADPDSFEPLVYPIGENALLNDDKTEDREPASDSPFPSVPTILSSVYIPSRVRVHLGKPGTNAQTVSVSFPYYIKNVASSEIYPTWPEESLKANIHAQVSLVLNRFFTEWYPSRGYDYDITNSTAYDQYFVYGRNIFDNVSRLVDEIFRIYIKRPDRIEPLFAEYCNGSTVSCAGMSQWGTVSLAQDGLTAPDILDFYYGNVSLVTADDIREYEASYPGSPLRRGDAGNDVTTIQQQLDRIAINYPVIPVVEVDGVFGSDTEKQVKEFQRIFSLTPDGVVGRVTWNRISYVYSSVKKLAELNSEGQRENYDTTEYPGVPLARGSKGNEVQQIQFYLSRIALFNPFIPAPSIDGIYLSGTEQSVLAFQNYYGLEQDGIVGEQTWNRIVSVYLNTPGGADPDGPDSTKPYPGAPLKTGSKGDNVVYVQQSLDRIAPVFLTVPAVAADGDFGRLTASAVRSFQELFGLSADGIVGRATWNKLNEVREAVENGCLFSSPAAPDLKSYPGYVIYIGSAGSQVTYIQKALNAIASAMPYLPRISEDGKFGRSTYNAVKKLQSLFGLASDGSVGNDTWTLINRLYSAVKAGCVTPAARETLALSEAVPEKAVPLSERFRLGSFGKEVADFKREVYLKTGIKLPEGMLYGTKSRKLLRDYEKKNS
ncbi:MAG: peptidoglycan-binding protein [Clostridia bacterium]|nr:peptidoglycan-binding protein [Clostridia bacterium]